MNEALRSGPGAAVNRERDVHCDRFLPNQPRIGADLLRYVSFCHRQGQIGAQQIAGPEAGLGIDAKGSGLGSCTLTTSRDGSKRAHRSFKSNHRNLRGHLLSGARRVKQTQRAARRHQINCRPRQSSCGPIRSASRQSRLDNFCFIPKHMRPTSANYYYDA